MSEASCDCLSCMARMAAAFERGQERLADLCGVPRDDQPVAEHDGLKSARAIANLHELRGMES